MLDGVEGVALGMVVVGRIEHGSSVLASGMDVGEGGMRRAPPPPLVVVVLLLLAAAASAAAADTGEYGFPYRDEHGIYVCERFRFAVHPVVEEDVAVAVASHANG